MNSTIESIESIRAEVAEGLRMIAFKDLTIHLPPMMTVDYGMYANGWCAVSEVDEGDDGTFRRYYYDTAQKNYVLATVSLALRSCTVVKVEETEVLEKLSFPELKYLASLIDKKSVAFIRIYSEKEHAAASGDELAALQERRQKMIDEAEVALRKR